MSKPVEGCPRCKRRLVPAGGWKLYLPPGTLVASSELVKCEGWSELKCSYLKVKVLTKVERPGQ